MTITAKQLDASLKKLELHFDKKFAHELWGQRKEFERYTGALNEHFGDQVKVIAEIASGIQAQLVAIRDMVAQNTEDIAIMKIELRKHTEDIAAIKQELSRHTEDITAIKMDLTSIKNMLRQKVDVEEFALLERRVARLEATRA